jgi:hypothetical protein
MGVAGHEARRHIAPQVGQHLEPTVRDVTVAVGADDSQPRHGLRALLSRIVSPMPATRRAGGPSQPATTGSRTAQAN